MDKTRQCHTLQDVHFPRHGQPVELYIRGQAAGTVKPAERLETVTMALGDRLSTETYFGCFYSSYWHQFTQVGRIGVRILFKGRLRIVVHRCTDATAPAEPVSQVALDEDAVSADDGHETILWLGRDPNGGGEDRECGRIFVELEALAPSHVNAISYVTDTPPVHDVTLSVGICTYNRETYLDATLKELVDAADRNAALRRVQVVNQGAPFASASLVQAFDDERLSLVEQGNLGGCGGFNRTMHDVLQDGGGCTHHLLMDDDIEIDARTIDTAVSFLRYAKDDVALGGHMLQSSSPMILSEAGAVFDPFLFVSPIGKGMDLAEPKNLDLFNACQHATYNGWWFCILPLRAIENVQFSPPMFIRCDDMEYGCRLSKHGVPTVSLPGVAVWHELNYSHAKDWDQYYDIRNRLILSALHGDLTPQPSALFVFGYVLECLLTHRYTAARMCMAGISDFLLGPDQLFFVDPAARHQQVIALSASRPQAMLEPAEALAHPWGEIVDRPATLWSSAQAYLRRFLSVLLLPYNTDNAKLYRYSHVHPVAVGNAAYIVTDARKTVFIQHTPRRRQVYQLLVRAFVLTVRFVAKRAVANRQWVNRVARYQTAESWQKLFKSGVARF